MPVASPTRNSRGRTHPVASVFVVVLATLSCLVAPGSAGAAAGASALDPQERAMCQQINTYRAANGLGALKLSKKLTKAATWMSTNMATNDYLNHDDSLGRTTFSRIRSFGYRSGLIGENLAAGLPGAQATFTSWKNDAPHRAAMVGPKYRVIGIGRAFSADSTLGWYWTTTFGAASDRAVAC